MQEINEKNKELFGKYSPLSLLILASFHLIRLFCEEYIKYLIDCKIDEKKRLLETSQHLNWNVSAQNLGFDVFPGNYNEEMCNNFFPDNQTLGIRPFNTNQKFTTENNGGGQQETGNFVFVKPSSISGQVKKSPLKKSKKSNGENEQEDVLTED